MILDEYKSNLEKINEKFDFLRGCLDLDNRKKSFSGLKSKFQKKVSGTKSAGPQK